MSDYTLNFTPTPERAIHVQGGIDQQTVYRLTPQIVSLQSQSRDPITVFIDSPGGLTDYKDSLYSLLRTSDQTFAEPCRLITVAMSLAASAAADLLSSGDYSLAYPDSSIMYHGIRVPPDRLLTAEEAYRLAQRLRTGNENFATQLARDAEPKFMFRFISHYNLLSTVHEEYPGITDIAAFQILIGDKISGSANEILRKARERHLRYSTLLNSVAKKWAKAAGKKTFLRFEVDQIKAIVEFEARQNKNNKAWRFEREGIYRLTDDFFLLNEYLAFFEGERFKSLVLRWGNFLLTPEQIEEIDTITEPEERDKKLLDTVSPQLRPVWSFFMALCHVLQQGDNHLSARDAFWLGLIDEVIGIPDLPSYRLFAEHAKKSAEKEKIKKDEANTEEETNAAGT